MGADASIYSMIRPAAPPEMPMDQMGKMLTLKSMMDSGQLNDLQRTKLQRDLTEEEQFRGLFNGATPESMNAPDFLQRAMGVSPARAMALQKNLLESQAQRTTIDKNKAETGKINLETANATAREARDALAGVSDQNGYNQFLQMGAEKGWKVALQAPPAFDPAWQRQHVMTADQFITQTTPKLERVQIDNGGKITTQMVDMNPVTNPGVKDLKIVTTKEASPDALLTDKRARSEGAANRTKDFTIAGMNPDGTPSQDVEAMAKGIAEGKLAPIGGFALARPRGQAIMARVMEMNPNYDAGDYAAKNGALKAFATGKEGATLRSLNTAHEHLGTLGNVAQALENGDTQLLNKAGNAWLQQTGSNAPTDFDAVKGIVAKEVVKAIVAGGGGVGEREEVEKLMDKANSPAQLQGVIQHFQELMDAQRSGLMDQYERTTGRKAGDQFSPSKRPAAAPTLPTGVKPADIDAELRRRGVIR
jgi:hypothetical protein